MGAHHLTIETGRWICPKLPRQHRYVQSAPTQLLRMKYISYLSAQHMIGFGRSMSCWLSNCRRCEEVYGSRAKLQVAIFVFECMDFRRSDDCEDHNPYLDFSLFGDEWQGRKYDTFSSGPGGDVYESLASTGTDSSISAHGA